MLLEYYGHSLFTITTDQGEVLATDPYGSFYQYPKRKIKADYCTISHHHHDHDGLSSFQNQPQIVDTPGVHITEKGVRILGVSTWHDHHGGAHRGENLLFVFELDGLRLAHCGDLGHIPTPAQAEEIGPLDVLLVPIGGNYTINAMEAVEVMRLLKPQVTIPMHYRSQYNPTMTIDSLQEFKQLTGADTVTPAPLLRLNAKDISQRESVLLMEILPEENGSFKKEH